MQSQNVDDDSDSTDSGTELRIRWNEAHIAEYVQKYETHNVEGADVIV